MTGTLHAILLPKKINNTPNSIAMANDAHNTCIKTKQANYVVSYDTDPIVILNIQTVPKRFEHLSFFEIMEVTAVVKIKVKRKRREKHTHTHTISVQVLHI